MSYQVLARKWRPQTFTDLVGQGHTVQALVNALDKDRLHHAYLFTGTRGVGKTTIARIFSKALNCENGVSAHPCGECGSCKEIEEGRFVDLIEVDAASRTRVDETRELLENVPYAPTRGRFKVYLIDEVHMFSNHSFNALLKTLEEPPPHVKFLLATTDPQKLPVTVLSRCLQFHLKRLTTEQIEGQLGRVLEAEGHAFEQPALLRLSNGADGSMRDALSLLDQAIAFGAGSVNEADVRTMLGDIESGKVFGLIQALADQDGAAMLAQIQALSEGTIDFAAALQELISVLHRIAVAQMVPETLDESDPDTGQMREFCSNLAAEDVQLFYQIGIIGQRDLGLMPDLRSGFEMVMLRMLAFKPVSSGGTVATAAKPTKRPAPKPAATPSPPAPVSAPQASINSNAPAVGGGGQQQWQSIIASMGVNGMARELANNCELVSLDETRVLLRLDSVHAHLASDNIKSRLHEALRQQCGDKVALEISSGAPQSRTPAQQASDTRKKKEQAARQSIEQDANVKALQDTFAARIVPENIEPID